MFSYNIDKIPLVDIDGAPGVYNIVSIYIRYLSTKIKVTPEHFKSRISDDEIEISSAAFAIICSPNMLTMDFHKTGNGFNTYTEINISKYAFDSFKNMVNEINEQLK